jgi:hypothetical protein
VHDVKDQRLVTSLEMSNNYTTTILSFFRIVRIVYRSMSISFAADLIYETYAMTSWRQARQFSAFKIGKSSEVQKRISSKDDTKHLL